MADVYFVTNRNPIPGNAHPTGFGPNFNTVGGPYLRVGVARLADPPQNDWAPGDLAIEKLEVYPDMTPVPGEPAKTRYGSQDMIEAIEKTAFDPQTPHDILLFIHGFDTKFEEALQLPAQMVANIDRARRLLQKNPPPGAPLPAASRPLIPVVFTWPSDGQTIPEVSYWNDRTDAEASKQALARIFLKLRDYLNQQLAKRLRSAGYDGTPRSFRTALKAGELECGVKIHLAAQSMGNFVLRHGLQAFRGEPTVVGHPLPRMFDQIFLTGADDDDEAFDKPDMLRPLPDLASQVTVYCNPGDKALFTSMTTKTLGKRLGQNGPKEVINVANLAAVNIEDVLAASGGDFTGHFYYRLNHEVHADMLYLMAGTPPPQAPGRKPVENNRYRLKYVFEPPKAPAHADPGFHPGSV